MNRLDRLTSILIMLQSKKLVRAKDIAEHFGISLRTIYRDIRSLEEAGLPISAEAGEGYRLVDGFHLPPVMFTESEASALFIGGKFVEKNTDKILSNHAKLALLKIISILPEDKRNFIDQINESTIVMNYSDADKNELDDYSLVMFQKSIINRTVLEIKYVSNNDEFTIRKIEPVSLVYYADAWHLIAYCRLRSDFRDFRISRIIFNTVLPEQFEKHLQFSLVDFFNLKLNTKDSTEFQILFPAKVYKNINRRNLAGLISEQIESNFVRCTFVLPSLDFAKLWLLSFGDQIEIVYPENLKSLVLFEAQKTVLKYS